MSSFYDRPILNSPYRAPDLHHPLDDHGQPLDDEPIRGRRPSRFIRPATPPIVMPAQAGIHVFTRGSPWFARWPRPDRSGQDSLRLAQPVH